MAATRYSVVDWLWYDVATAPAEIVLLLWGNGPMRFGYRDHLGQWRGRHNHPMKSPPKLWSACPRPPHIERPKP